MTGYLTSWAASVLPTQLFSSNNPDTSASASSNTDGEPTISKLVVYPIKSCAGIEVQESPYSITGLDYDRQWMLVDMRSKKMITARNEIHAKTFLIQPRLQLEIGVLSIHIPNHGEFEIPIDPPADADRLEDLQVWGSYDLQGHIMSPEGSKLQKALSAHLSTPVLLIKFDQSAPRVLDKQQYLADLFSSFEDSLDYPLEDCTTYFADGYPFLIASEASFRQVDEWLKAETVDTRMEVNELVKRYRPNIVIKGAGEPFAEDSWEEVKLGDQIIFPVSRCQRCPMPDVSPATGTLSARRLPGTIVAKHRSNVDRLVKGACVGVNAISKRRNGTLQVGMKLEVIRQAQPNTEDKLNGKWLRAEDRWS
ncbi:hypothetical protein P389DRAFT_197485 [Cystobasidium minutum MCA 4210]|uniref:uncharacterized protein n=1 Tax=Cystobasidium minutum MCA 4210 TaxID=1397322 RepID=UPI0034CE2C84|eukprot:jgi/Rhomi1/197485/gm1.5699_g